MKLEKSRTQDGRALYRLEVDGNIAIPGDIHIPFHDPVALNTFIRVTSNCSTLVILGDMFDYYGLSTFPKTPAKVATYSLLKEVEVAKPWIKRFSDDFEHVIMTPGNHEVRWGRVIDKNPALAGMEWWWPLRDFIPQNWTMLDVNSRIELRRAGQRIWLEHGDKASRNSSYVSADKLTALYPGQTTIIGHNHRLAAHHRTHWINNKPVESHAYSVGHLSNISKLGYVSAPDWQKGGMVISSSGFQLVSIKGESALWL